MTFASLALATALAWVAPASAGLRPAVHNFRDADGNVAFTAPGVDWKATAATAKDGGKPERVVWSDGSYPYALLSEEDRAYVDAELADFAKEEAEKAEERKRLEFYDADGNLVFTGRIVYEQTAATAKDGGKPERVFWSAKSRNGSYPYALLSEEDRAFVDAELTKFAERNAALENVKKAAAEAKANWEKEAPQTPEIKRVEGRKIAVLFGCDQFEDTAISDLEYAASDASFLAERLIERGFGSKDVLVLTNEHTTREKLLEVLKILAEYTKSGDMIFVAFLGQGVEIDGETYWTPTDADVDDLAGTCVALSDFTAKLDAATPGREKAIFFDACRVIPNDLMKNEQKTDAKPAEAKPRSGGENVWTLYACEAGGLAYELDAFQHGVFTYSFAEGLTEEGDANGDGVVTLMEAFFYAKARTTTTAKQDFKVEQTPVAVGPFADLEMVDLNAAPQKTQNWK
ncbi:MAG: caspase family protein [Thermoguttaceae bacterium]|nr:caspase family protein [Thermoguttaceae bacterium]